MGPLIHETRERVPPSEDSMSISVIIVIRAHARQVKKAIYLET